MANPEHIKILKQGAWEWNEWRKLHPQTTPDLSNYDFQLYSLDTADLSNCDLSETDLRGLELSHTNFRGSNLSYANLSLTDLSSADMSNANLLNADLWRAKIHDSNLAGANLRGAALAEASFIDSNLSNIDLAEANLHSTLFINTKIINSKNLDICNFTGPCRIDLSTLNMSDNFPIEFLRGCGLSDWEIGATKLYQPNLSPTQITEIVYEIDHLRSEKPFQFYSCFISYSSKDEDFADRLYADLQDNGVRCWFAPEDMKIGDKIRQRIDESIRIYDKLLLILSENSINSTWVEKEVETAFEKEARSGQPVLFPIRLDNSVMETSTSWAADIRRTRHIGDFTRWKAHDAYQAGFERLLRDLRGDGKKSG